MKMYISIVALLMTLVAMPLSAYSVEQAGEVDTLAVVDNALMNANATDDVLWDNANTLYVNGKYSEAADGYLAILQRGKHSAKLYYNLANAYFKMGEIGPAILCYHRALRLDPGSDDIRYNLEVAQEHTKDRIEQVPEFFLSSWMRAVRNTLSVTMWGVLSLLFLSLVAICMLFYLLGTRLAMRKAGFYGAVVMVLFLCATTFFAAQGRQEIIERNDAVVMSKSVSVKSSPDRASTDLFVIHEGTLVEITDSMNEWREIVIADGKKGWVRGEQVEVI